MNKIVEIINLGFSVADAVGIKFQFNGDHLQLDFVDWQGNPVSVKFENTIGFRYQLAEYQISNSERFDSTHIVKDSEWVKTHLDQGEAWPSENWNHYKLNFNGGSIIEILCSNVIEIK